MTCPIIYCKYVKNAVFDHLSMSARMFIISKMSLLYIRKNVKHAIPMKKVFFTCFFMHDCLAVTNPACIHTIIRTLILR